MLKFKDTKQFSISEVIEIIEDRCVDEVDGVYLSLVDVITLVSVYRRRWNIDKKDSSEKMKEN